MDTPELGVLEARIANTYTPKPHIRWRTIEPDFASWERSEAACIQFARDLVRTGPLPEAILFTDDYDYDRIAAEALRMMHELLKGAPEITRTPIDLVLRIGKSSLKQDAGQIV